MSRMVRRFEVLLPLRFNDGTAVRPRIVCVSQDVPDAPESREYFVAAKERLKGRFQQFDIWMTTYLIEVI